MHDIFSSVAKLRRQGDSNPHEPASQDMAFWFRQMGESHYTDIDRDDHEISRFGGLPRELYFPEVRSTEGKYTL